MLFKMQNKIYRKVNIWFLKMDFLAELRANKDEEKQTIKEII